MLKISETEINRIIHELIHIASILKAIENGCLSPGQTQIIKGCETRLYEIRQDLLCNVETNGDSKGG